MLAATRDFMPYPCNYQMTSNKFQTNSKPQSSNVPNSVAKDPPEKRKYDLEDRTFKFAKDVIEFAKRCTLRGPENMELVRQLVKAGTSVGANNIEANEALSRKDFVMRIKISRKEAKESAYWLRLIELNSAENEPRRERLISEATELVKIFNAIVVKSS